MRKPSKSKSGPTPERVEAYRKQATRGDVLSQIEGLNAHAGNFEVLGKLGDFERAIGATRAWLEDAVALGATPARTIEEANIKITYLQAALDAWVVPTAQADGHVNAAGMILSAVMAETRRWGLTGSPAGLN